MLPWLAIGRGLDGSQDEAHDGQDRPADVEEVDLADDPDQDADELSVPGTPGPNTPTSEVPLSPAPQVVKIAVTVDSQRGLLELDQSLPLEKVVRALCREHHKKWEPGQMALQFLHYGSGSAGRQAGIKFVTEDNRRDIRNGAELKLTPSPQVLCDDILQHISASGRTADDRTWGLQRLADLAPDRAFLQVFAARSGAVNLVLLFLLAGDRISVVELNCCLSAVLWLLRHRLISALQKKAMRRVASFVRAEHTVDTNVLESSLAILTVLSEPPYDVAVVEVVGIGDVAALLWDQERPGVQRAALELMNTLADRHLRGGEDCAEAKQNVIKIVTSLQVRQTVANYILSNPVDRAMARQLLRLQTLLLRPLKTALETPASDVPQEAVKDSALLQPPRLPPHRRNTTAGGARRAGVYAHSRSWNADDSSEREDHDGTARAGSVERRSLGDSPHYKVLGASNVSVASMATDGQPPQDRDTLNALSAGSSMNLLKDVLAFGGSSISLASEGSRHSWMDSEERLSLSELGAECLRYLKSRYPALSERAAVEEEAYRGTLTNTAERLARLLGDELGLRGEGDDAVPDRTVYQPLFFSAPLDQPYFQELFCRAISLLAKTRREMRAKTTKDQDKVLRVVRRQFREALRLQRSSWDAVDRSLADLSYSAVAQLWEKERSKAERDSVLRAPAVQQLKKARAPALSQLVRQHHMAVLRAGARFPKSALSAHRSLREKSWSKRGFMFAWLGAADSVLQYADCTEDGALLGATTSLPLSSVTAVVTGVKCPHMRSSRGRKHGAELAFSLLLDPHDCDSESLDFIAPDKEILAIWVDGLSILLGHKPRMKTVQNDLEEILEMEVRLQLLELEGIDLPTEPPPVPPPPPDYNFVTS